MARQDTELRERFPVTLHLDEQDADTERLVYGLLALSCGFTPEQVLRGLVGVGVEPEDAARVLASLRESRQIYRCARTGKLKHNHGVLRETASDW